MKRLVTAAMALALASFSERSWAIGDDGAAIDDSNYTLDLYQGPVLAGSRVVGMAGAFTAVAEGVPGFYFNPASVAHRVPWSTNTIDFDLDGGFTLPSSVVGFDFDNNGDDSFSNDTALFVTGGLGLQIGPGGVGATVDYQLYQVLLNDEVMNVSILRPTLYGGFGFLDGELVFGLGIGLNIVDISRAIVLGGSAEDNKDRAVASVNGLSFHGGVLWAPNYAPIRLGAAVRWSLPPSAQPGAEPDCSAPCVSEGGNYYYPDPANPNDPAARFYLPRTIALPNEIWAGAALQLFRQFNHGWVDPKEEPSHYRRVAAQIEAEHAQRESQPASADGASGEAEQERLEKREQEREARDAERLKIAREKDRLRRLIPYKKQPREKVMLSVAVRVTLPNEDGVGLDSFLSQTVERSGEKVTVGPHIGVESEVWPGYLVLRGGTYLEPTRFRAGSDRWHGTGGLDVRLPFEWNVFGLFDDDTGFRVGGAVDGTVRYFGWNVSAGIWR